MDCAVDLVLGNDKWRRQQQNIVEQWARDETIVACCLGDGCGANESGRWEAFLGVLLGDDFNTGHQSERTYIPHMRKLEQFVEPPAKVATSLGDSRNQVLALDDIEIGKRDRTGYGVTRIGETMHEGLILWDGMKCVEDRLAHDDSAERDVAAGDALGEGQHVWDDRIAIDAEIPPSSAKSSDDLVGYHENLVAVAHLS